MIMAGRLGGKVQAAYTIGLRLEMLAIMLAFPIANACATLVGQNLGARNLGRAWSAIWASSAVELAAITRDRAAGRRVGFVRASFDLLRVDVVRVLQAAAAKSDRLAVAVVDEGGTPVVSVRDRAELIDGLRGVHYVVVCAKDNVDRLIALLAPLVT